MGESMNNLKLMPKFWLLSGALLAILSLQIGGILYNNSTVKDNVAQLAEHQVPLLDKAHQLKLSVVQVQQWLTDISATRGLDGLNDGFDEAENNAQLFYQLIDELKQIDPDNSRTYEAMLPAFKNYYETGKTMAQAYVDRGPLAGNKLMASFDEAAATLSDQVNEFVAMAQSSAQSVARDSEATIENSALTTLALSAILLLVVGLVFVLFLGISKCIPRISQALGEIAAGNLDIADMASDRRDELGELTHNTNSMKQALRKILSELHDSAVNLRESAHAYASNMEDTMSCMTQQKGKLDHIAHAMEQMSEASKNMAEDSDKTRMATSTTTSNAQASQVAVQHSKDKIQSMAHESHEGVAVIADLRDQSGQISSILDVIRDIADQTNLLALNAAIEAARAGDQGRGFAVVADEVRHLAQRTQDSTQQIQTMIEALQNSALKAERVIELGEKQGQDSVEIIDDIDQRIHAISQSITDVDEMSQHIAATAAQQSAVAQEMSADILTIYDVCEHTTNNTEALSVASSKLDEMADNLARLSERFRL